jgi:hypothetical protein
MVDDHGYFDLDGEAVSAVAAFEDVNQLSRSSGRESDAHIVSGEVGDSAGEGLLDGLAVDHFAPAFPALSWFHI